MKKILAITSTVLLLGSYQFAGAQERPHLIHIQYKTGTASPIPPSSLDERFQICMEDADCPAKDRIKILTEMSETMNQVMQNIGRECAAKNFIDCISIESEQTRQWYKMNKNMRQMMQAMEDYNDRKMNRKTPFDHKYEQPQEDIYNRVDNNIPQSRPRNN